MTSCSPADLALRAESLRILTAIDDTEKGVAFEWRNVQPAVLASCRHSNHVAIDTMGRIDRLEQKLEHLVVAVNTLIDDRRVKEERYASDNRAFARSWQTLTDDHQQLRDQTARADYAASEGLRVLREVALPELQQELDSVKEVHKLQTRKEVRLEHAEKDIDMLRQHKVDAVDFNAAIRELRSRLEQSQLFLSPTMGGHSMSSVAAGGGGGGLNGSDTALGFAVGGCAKHHHRGSVYRWLWTGGSFTSACSKAIPWSERLVKSGDGIRWNSQHPHIIKIDHEAIYRLSVAVFHNGRDHHVPTVTVYINADAVLHAISTNSSSCILRPLQPSSTTDKRGLNTSVAGCACEPRLLNGVSCNELFYFPAGSVITVAYRADPRNVMQAVLDLETIT